MVFDDDQGNRFALHIENKPNWGKFLAGQAEAYAPRALQMANQPKFLSYSESTTILICPESFQKSNSTACGHFEAVITFEEVGRYVKAFKEEANP